MAQCKIRGVSVNMQRHCFIFKYIYMYIHIYIYYTYISFLLILNETRKSYNKQEQQTEHNIAAENLQNIFQAIHSHLILICRALSSFSRIVY